ncbi:leupaxin-like isoform X3 [Tachypleus tridentatus]|uniref:leupaxin-like isoform X3 n=2 Tax=Tachypleus tridentatus TaxID=6853 RepID=UPI003FD11C96
MDEQERNRPNSIYIILGKLRFSDFLTLPHQSSERFLLNALLEDLQAATTRLINTNLSCLTQPTSSGQHVSENRQSLSNSLKTSSTKPCTDKSTSGPYRSEKMSLHPGSHSTTHTVTTQRYEYYHGDDKSDPIYQNHQIQKEVTKTTISSTQHPSQPTSSTNEHLSELDSLLEDLNTARLTPSYPDHKGSTVNGVTSSSTDASTPRYGCIRPTTKPPPEDRPTVESLLDDLQSVVTPTSKLNASPTSVRPVRQNYVTTVTYTKEIPEPPPATTPATSSATKELDDLMASLTDFKKNRDIPSSPTTVEPVQKEESKVIRSDELDSMLGNLQTDMSKQGVKTTAKGQCAACKKTIVGQVITALGQTWHPEHFTCKKCGLELGTMNFFEREGEPYCEGDYHKIFAPRCGYCEEPIQDKCVTALDKTWHLDHFFCAHCRRPFGDDGFHEKDGKPYCRKDFFDIFAPKCGGCNKPIKDNYISALNGQWHSECFVCKDCGQSFNGGSFYDHEGQPYCETHYHAKRGSLCAGCKKPIAGRCITAMFRKFHPEHFVCSFCLKQLNKGTFKEHGDKPYCHACFGKLYG